MEDYVKVIIAQLARQVQTNDIGGLLQTEGDLQDLLQQKEDRIAELEKQLKQYKQGDKLALPPKLCSELADKGLHKIRNAMLRFMDEEVVYVTSSYTGETRRWHKVKVGDTFVTLTDKEDNSYFINLEEDTRDELFIEIYEPYIEIGYYDLAVLGSGTIIYITDKSLQTEREANVLHVYDNKTTALTNLEGESYNLDDYEDYEMADIKMEVFVCE